MTDESPVAAVERVLRHHDIKPSNLLVMMLIEAVRDTTPPPHAMTISVLKGILQSLHPHNALDAWTVKSARQIVEVISKQPVVRAAAKLIGDETLWCALEGTIAGLLSRVVSGKDLES